VTFGNGSNELIELLVRTFTTREHHIVFAEPSFVVYRMAALAHGVAFTAVPLLDQVHDLIAMRGAVNDRTRLVFIANPNNPTGTYVTEAALSEFLSRLPRSVIPVLDEAYFEYATERDYPNSLELRDLHPNLVVLRTFSKAYGLAALRLGFAVSPALLADYMNRVRAPFNANSIAQAAAMAALEDEAHLAAVVKENTAGRAILTRGCVELGLRVWPSQANFVLVDVGRSAQSVYEQLLQVGVITRPIASLPQCLRISVGLPEENTRLLSALKAVLA
jgi:histidinol-phosphate aminotransferase